MSINLIVFVKKTSAHWISEKDLLLLFTRTRFSSVILAFLNCDPGILSTVYYMLDELTYEPQMQNSYEILTHLSSLLHQTIC